LTLPEERCYAAAAPSRGARRRLESSRLIHPRRVGGRRHPGNDRGRLAESARLLLTKDIHGVCLQSQIDPDHFMEGPFVAEIYHR
jgi:hypothetical protein